MANRFQVLFHNKAAGRLDDFGYHEFQNAPRVGENLTGVDPDEVRGTVRVCEVTHRPGIQATVLIVEDIT